MFGGVNRLSASYARVGESVTVGEIARTKMAGDPALVKLGDSFAQTRGTVNGG